MKPTMLFVNKTSRNKHPTSGKTNFLLNNYWSSISSIKMWRIIHAILHWQLMHRFENFCNSIGCGLTCRVVHVDCLTYTVPEIHEVSPCIGHNVLSAKFSQPFCQVILNFSDLDLFAPLVSEFAKSLTTFFSQSSRLNRTHFVPFFILIVTNFGYGLVPEQRHDDVQSKIYSLMNKFLRIQRE